MTTLYAGAAMMYSETNQVSSNLFSRLLSRSIFRTALKRCFLAIPAQPYGWLLECLTPMNEHIALNHCVETRSSTTLFMGLSQRGVHWGSMVTIVLSAFQAGDILFRFAIDGTMQTTLVDLELLLHVLGLPEHSRVDHVIVELFAQL